MAGFHGGSLSSFWRLVWCWPICFFFCLCFWCPLKKKKNHTRMYLKKLTSKFSSRSCTVSGLTFKFFIHFELIFGYAVRQGSRFSNTVYSRDDRSPLYILASFFINGQHKNVVSLFFPPRVSIICQRLAFLFLCKYCHVFIILALS